MEKEQAKTFTRKLDLVGKTSLGYEALGYDQPPTEACQTLQKPFLLYPLSLSPILYVIPKSPLLSSPHQWRPHLPLRTSFPPPTSSQRPFPSLEPSRPLDSSVHDCTNEFDKRRYSSPPDSNSLAGTVV
ncbi:hypothetical protein RHMOL_Rhmol03G0192500 [Rhododendron molle]|uniref:Uncharacterized protein n=1 Tax=Rhododendron molle TaxID=49168 RepID=A0ACC0PHN7_RHOML|nr:hypothetical protein RHMOL_Rhmol03G0192500 [Rhododendron molle]